MLQELHWLWAVAEVWPLHEQAHTVVLLPGIQHQGQQNVPLHHRQFHEGTVTYWRKLMSNKILQSFINFIDSSVSNYFLQTNMPVSWHMYHISFRLLLAMHKCYIHLYRNFSEIFLVIFFFSLIVCTMMEWSHWYTARKMLNRRRLDGCGEEVTSNTTKIISGTKPHQCPFLLRATVNTVIFFLWYNVK